MMKEKTDPSQYSAPALEKGLDILELLAEVSPGLTQNQIAARLTIRRSPSELVRMIEVLERRGYLGRTSLDSTYQLTLKCSSWRIDSHRSSAGWGSPFHGCRSWRVRPANSTTWCSTMTSAFWSWRRWAARRGWAGGATLNGCRLFRRGR